MRRFNTRYDRRVVGWESSMPSMTDEADFPSTLIENIFAAHGQVPDRRIQFGDFTRMPLDPAEAQEALAEAERQFMALPSDIRDRFDNSPLALIHFLDDVNNRDEAIKLGLITPPPPAAPANVSPEAPASPAAEAGSTSSH